MSTELRRSFRRRVELVTPTSPPPARRPAVSAGSCSGARWCFTRSAASPPICSGRYWFTLIRRPPGLGTLTSEVSYTHTMSKRLQVLLPDAEMDEIRRTARREHLTVGEWARRALRLARSKQPAGDPQAKLRLIREAAKLSYPTADIDQMLQEIERGYLED